MTQDELNKIKERVKLLPENETWHNTKYALYANQEDRKDILIFGLNDDPANFEFSEHDLEFIAHAREDIPALLAEVESIRRQLEVAREALEYYGDKENWSREDQWVWMPKTTGRVSALHALAEMDKEQREDNGR